MIKRITAIATTLLLAASVTTVFAQDDQNAPKRERRPAPPVMAALDANKDGVIDSAELANATAALKSLDANKDGQLTGEEVHPFGGKKGPRAHGKKGDRECGPGCGPKGGPEGEVTE